MPSKKKLTVDGIRAWVAKARGDADAYEKTTGGNHKCNLVIGARRGLLNDLEKVLGGKVGPTEDEFEVTISFTVSAEDYGEAHGKVHHLLVQLQNEQLDVNAHGLLMRAKVDD